MIYPHPSLRVGLQGAWCPSLGATGYTLIDRSGFGNHGTLTNMGGQSNWPADYGGTAISTDGTDDLVILGTATQLRWSTVRSLSIWIYPRAKTPDGDVFTMWDLVGGVTQRSIVQGWRSGVFTQQWSPDGNGDSVGITSSNVATNKWSHVCSVFRAGVRELWINGVMAGSVSQASIYTGATTSRLGLGGIPARAGDTAGYFSNGLIDDARIYGRAISPVEIRLLARARGIGLLAKPQHRTSASSRRLYVKVEGVWKETLPHVKVGGVWKEGAVWQNVGGTWKN